MQETKSRSADMNTLLFQNKLKYGLPSNLNVVERRQNKISFADQNTYTSASGSELVIRLTASTDYVYGKNCYLAFEVKTLVGDITPGGYTGVPGFKDGTALNLFSRMLLEDRSGAELERDEALNRYARQYLPWKMGADSLSTTVAMAGQQQSGFPADPTAVPPTYLANGPDGSYNTVTATGLTVCIPLWWFLGVFDRETLIPPTLLSGALLRLQLAAPGAAFQATSAVASTIATVAAYTISNPRIVTDSMSLAPVVQKNLMEQSQAGGGLDFIYETRYYQSASPGTSSSFSLQVNKAVVRCQKLVWAARAEEVAETPVYDNLGTTQFNLSSLQTRVGDLYFPQRVISLSGTSPTLNGSEFYENSLQSMQRMKTFLGPPSITKNKFLLSGIVLGAVLADNNNSGYATHVQSFEQSSALEYSGLAINNSRTAEARIEFQGTPAAKQIIDAWICFIKVAKSSQLRSVIKE